MHPRKQVSLPEKEQVQGPSGWACSWNSGLALDPGTVTPHWVLLFTRTRSGTPLFIIWETHRAKETCKARTWLTACSQPSLGPQGQKNPLCSQSALSPSQMGLAWKSRDGPNLPTPAYSRLGLQEVPNPQFEPRALVILNVFVKVG